MEFLTNIDVPSLLEQGNLITLNLITLVVTISSLLTMFIDESKVNKYVKPVLKVLNFLSLNIFKNKNKTDD